MGTGLEFGFNLFGLISTGKNKDAERVKITLSGNGVVGI